MEKQEKNTKDYLQDLKNAIRDICVHRCCSQKNRNFLIENERSFAYELYRTWSNYNYSDLIINAEVSKHVDSDFKKEAESIFGKETHYFIPDMVLHHSQYDSDNQKIICEIKTNTNLNKENFIKDIKKLHAYTKDNGAISHPFENGVFILVSGELSDLTDKVTKKDFDNIQSKKILIFTCNIEKNDNQFVVEEYSLESFKGHLK